jgi:molybdenum cofactor cytidylyltransferase
LGEPKQLIRLGGENLLEHTVRVCREAGCAPVVVVLGAYADEVRRQSALADSAVVINGDWVEGMGSSVRSGVGELSPEVEGCVIATCDQPAITAEHLHALMASGEVTASAYAGRHGVPAYFPRAVFGELMKLHGDAGARELLKDARALELAGGELDVDTAADKERALELFGRHPA